MYARKVDNKELTFCVSGKLWNRSLVMLDIETESLWSHILGQAMDGELKGTRLEILPAEMVRWREWRKAHPETTVLNLPPTRHREYTKAFYEKDPQRFVFGAVLNGSAWHASWPDLLESPVRNVRVGDSAILLTTDADSTAVRIFRRELDGEILRFELAESAIRDQQTGSRWNLRGEAIDGPRKGKRLEPLAGLMSFRTAWMTFHPRSQSFQDAPKGR